jgi:hypothetical protein
MLGLRGYALPLEQAQRLPIAAISAIFLLFYAPKVTGEAADSLA